MNESMDKEMESVRRLIDRESQAGLDRFQRRDFHSAWERRLRERLLSHPASSYRLRVILAICATSAVLLAVLIAVILPYIEVKREIREIKEILMRVPEMRTPIPSLSLSHADEETKKIIIISWIFKLAEERLNPREMTAAELQSLIEKAFAAPAPEPFRKNLFRKLSKGELLLLEKRIRALIAEGELQRLRRRKATNQL